MTNKLKISLKKPRPLTINPEEFVNYYYENEQLLAGVQSMVLEDVVVDYILEQAEVTEKTVTYDELKSESQQVNLINFY